MAIFSLISLGCEKNLVNSEQMLYLLTEAGHQTGEPEQADVVIVNTCGFIDSAKSEAIDTILELAALREESAEFKIIVTGCLAQRHPDEIFEQLPEVDGLLGTGSYDDIVIAVTKVLNGEKPRIMGDINAPITETKRCVTSPRWYSYLRVAEGCDNHCAYCVIPSLRGRYRSRKMEDILDEAKALAESGTKELILIAQDVTRYGKDFKDGTDLAALVTELCKIEGIEWIRLHYLYPDEITDRLLEVMAKEEKVLGYFDLPIQHVSDKILKSMNRRTNKAQLETLLGKIRALVPNAVLRTSIICGLPGEHEEEFEELAEFLRKHKLQRAGFFAFSPQEGTKAAAMDDQIPEEIALERVRLLTQLQDEIMHEFDLDRLGSHIKVLCEGYDESLRMYFGRSYADSPGVDEQIFFSSSEEVAPGQFVTILAEDLVDDQIHGVAVWEE